MTRVKSAEPWTDNSNTFPHTVHLTLLFLLGSPSSPGSGSPVLSFYPHKSTLSLQLRKRRTYLCPTSEQPMSHRKAANHRGDRDVASPARRRMRAHLLTRGRETQPDYSAKTGHCLNTALWLLAAGPLLPLTDCSVTGTRRQRLGMRAPRPAGRLGLAFPLAF